MERFRSFYFKGKGHKLAKWYKLMKMSACVYFKCTSDRYTQSGNGNTANKLVLTHQECGGVSRKSWHKLSVFKYEAKQKKKKEKEKNKRFLFFVVTDRPANLPEQPCRFGSAWPWSAASWQQHVGSATAMLLPPLSTFPRQRSSGHLEHQLSCFQKAHPCLEKFGFFLRFLLSVSDCGGRGLWMVTS